LTQSVSLGSTQREFTQDIADLIQFIYDSGYECTFGDAFRDPRSHGEMGDSGPYGRRRSAHKQRLAVDLNLFLNGEYLSTTEAHRPFGEFWKGMHQDNRWGGDFDDGNHYSRKYGGIA
jgi:hypothetical protein